MRYLPVIIPLALTIYAAVDCLRTPDDEVKHLPKPIWLILVLLVWVAGPIIWLIAGRDRGLSRPAEGRPIAPDDDPEFLRRLGENRENRRDERDQQGDGQP
ncbi:MAG TPA: PLD nuclease N-terminal domain-containing protein [Actinomycetales bacterium]|nr:PLD nuclease N-terminal domain-containing protein [Actinomycetales bacterium]